VKSKTTWKSKCQGGALEVETSTKSLRKTLTESYIKNKSKFLIQYY